MEKWHIFVFGFVNKPNTGLYPHSGDAIPFVCVCVGDAQCGNIIYENAQLPWWITQKRPFYTISFFWSAFTLMELIHF